MPKKKRLLDEQRNFPAFIATGPVLPLKQAFTCGEVGSVVQVPLPPVDEFIVSILPLPLFTMVTLPSLCSDTLASETLPAVRELH
jgi:hypothetical protein